MGKNSSFAGEFVNIKDKRMKGGSRMENVNGLLEKQRIFFAAGKTMDVSFRIQALQTLRTMIKANEALLMDALKSDLNKNEFFSYMTEIGIVLGELSYTLKHISKWAKPRRVKTSLPLFGSKSFIYPEPYGSVLIIAPWNYPFQLIVAPLIGAIAAGNCAILKPSEFTPKTSAVIAKLIGETFPEEFIAVVQGGVETSGNLLKEKFDYIFFTGSVPVGRIIMKAAAEHLTPVTLELGGKSPCIVHEDANLKLAAKRIAWGKFINAGQTCVAPDYLMVHKNVKEEFLTLLKLSIQDLYANVHEKGYFTKIVSKQHFNRLLPFLTNGTVSIGGRYDEKTLIIEPTVLENILWEDEVMQEEIFGPILPVLEYESLSIALKQINEKPKPLALYLFSESKHVQESVLSKISFGGGCINDTVFHLSSPHLPFGGVGESGIGAYHGKGSFDVFSHKKSILKQTTRFDLPFRYQNTKNGLKMLRQFFK